MNCCHICIVPKGNVQDLLQHIGSIERSVQFTVDLETDTSSMMFRFFVSLMVHEVHLFSGRPLTSTSTLITTPSFIRELWFALCPEEQKHNPLQRTISPEKCSLCHLLWSWMVILRSWCEFSRMTSQPTPEWRALTVFHSVFESLQRILASLQVSVCLGPIGSLDSFFWNQRVLFSSGRGQGWSTGCSVLHIIAHMMVKQAKALSMGGSAQEGSEGCWLQHVCLGWACLFSWTPYQLGRH